MGRQSMLANINRTLQITLTDGRELTGKLLVYDRHMNVVLADTQESRKETKKMKDAGISPQRNLGLIVLRGEHVMAVSVVENSKGEEGKQVVDFKNAPREKGAVAKRSREQVIESGDGSSAGGKRARQA
ncbi:putative small nuclear ribonucleoprotein [Trypanosoma vivax]|uniref:Sm protein B n=1 Tax=Trypanosoma vivax (strain Y486) TaxID=1055687 RepID=G0TRZ5_TRYVY|nr:putative small nuclear ribonucleoprotein [Trypanosoma vivax]CCC46719.1 putative small nuclear ribonucleoprotein protein [Trypanosoma vivax Y486]